LKNRAVVISIGALIVTCAALLGFVVIGNWPIELADAVVITAYTFAMIALYGMLIVIFIITPLYILFIFIVDLKDILNKK